jgi:DNA polymerase III subunit delta
VSAPALLLVLGDEELLATRAVAEVVDEVRGADPLAAVHEFQAGDLLPGQLTEALSPSLFGGRPVVIVYSGQDAKKDLAAAIVAYAAQPDPGASLVICHAGGAKGKALADALKSAGAQVVLAAKPARYADRVDFVRGEIRRLGGRANGNAAEALLEAVGNDLRELAAACAQLVADTDGHIDVAVVRRYYKGRAEASGFTVADAAVAGDVPAALEALRWALSTGVDPVPIADAIADGVRTIARVASARGGNAYQMAGKLGMPAWKIEKAQRMARGWSPEGLVDAMAAAAVCNAEVKGASDDREYALERAILAVAAARTEGGKSRL